MSWIEIQLGKLGKTFTGLSGKTKDDFGTGKPYIPYLNIFTNSKINPDHLEYVRLKKDENQNQVIYGDLFFTTSSETVEEVGMTSVLLCNIGEVYLNSFCFGFRLHDFETLLPEYAPYLFRHDIIRHKISLQGQGSTRYNLSKTELLKKLVLKIPPISEQTHIAEILTAADETIAITEALIAKYQRIKTGLMQDLLTRGIDEQGNIRSKSTHKFVLKNGIEVPEEWEVVVVKDRITLNYGKSQKLVVSDNGSFPIYGSSGIMGYAIQPLFDKPSVLIGRKGTLDNPQYLVSPFWCVDTTYYVSEFKNGDMKWLYYFLTTMKLSSLSEATGVPSLLRETFYSLNFAFPPIEEQKKTIQIIDSIVNELNSLEKQLSKLQAIKIGLMQDLLSGRVRVKIEEN